ncbi:cell division protein FtsL [Ancylobacter sp.]|uniref:cell division protein FtsL n=1 Tax=Ancylobacter sp. TaxID=1872567 RepID=UPI003D0C6D1B
MFRILNAVSVIALLAAAGIVYHVKYSSAFEAQEIAKLRTEIRGERDRIALLHAEWARRTAPDRIQALAEKHLDMQPLDVDHMDRLAMLPAKSEAGGDALGGMIEALVDGPSLNPAPAPAAAPKPAKPARTAPVARLPDDAPLPEQPFSAEPLPLSAMPSAGTMGAPRRSLAGPQGIVGAPLDPAAGAPMLPPGDIGQ